MKIGIVLVLFIALFASGTSAQQRCSSAEYQKAQLLNDPSLQNKVKANESFTKNAIKRLRNVRAKLDGSYVIRIPVVVHILYHDQSDDVSDSRVMEQIDALNRDYRRLNADTTNTPNRFKPFAADCNIEFHLATSDPHQRYTNGIVRKYTPIKTWEEDDQMKFSSSYGDDAWDADSYLNIWVCNIKSVLGYSSFIGGPKNLDGVVISNSVFGQSGVLSSYSKGRTTVHEVGHWLSLIHIWGDTDCGDDQVDDTPRQSTYTVGCPSGVKISCDNGPDGNMYMNYMDFTYDACMNMFTYCQKERMRVQFEPGGSRYSILFSKGLDEPLYYEVPVPDRPPTWLHPQVFPNPATNEITLDLSYDSRWIGKTVNLVNLQGQTIKSIVVNSRIQKIDISKFSGGIYFLSARRSDGEIIREKFVKQ